MNEIWKDVVGYEGIYEVSNTGKVRTHEDKTTYTKMHGIRKWSQRTLKQKVTKDKTCRVSLWKDGKEKTWLVHRLVAFAFLPKVEGKDYINHIGGCRLDNTVSNLEWCNHTENNNHAIQNGLRPEVKVIGLVNVSTGEVLKFRGMRSASYFLGRSHGYISNCLKRGDTEIDGFNVIVQGISNG